LALLGLTGIALVDGFEKGFKQVKIEFAYLNYNLSVSYPLVEFFILNEVEIATTRPSRTNEKRNLQTGRVQIQNGYEFLANVVWTKQDRDEEIKDVARAAFGPVGAFISARLGASSKKK
jgi:hypothetical protein